RLPPRRVFYAGSRRGPAPSSLRPPARREGVPARLHLPGAGVQVPEHLDGPARPRAVAGRVVRQRRRQLVAAAEDGGAARLVVVHGQEQPAPIQVRDEPLYLIPVPLVPDVAPAHRPPPYRIGGGPRRPPPRPPFP